MGLICKHCAPVTSSIYVMVLRKDLPSPLVPQSDEEKSASEQKDDQKDKGKDEAKDQKDKSDKSDKAKDIAKDQKDKTPPEVRIDFDNISQRILAVPVPDKNYLAVAAGKDGVLFLEERPIVEITRSHRELIVTKFDFKTRKTDTVLQGATVFKLSENGEKVLFRQAEQWVISNADQAPKPNEGVLKLAGTWKCMDPRAEWKQMYHEVWRIERDFLYDPGCHGLDLTAAGTKLCAIPRRHLPAGAI